MIPQFQLLPNRRDYHIVITEFDLPDPCDPSPCKNKGVCEKIYGNAKCTCINGFTGDKCEIPPAGKAEIISF